MPKAIIFDVDGTLVDSVDLHAQAWVDAFAEFGFPQGFDAVRRQIGKGGDQLMPVFLTPEQIEAIGKDLEAHRGRIMKERYLPQVKAFPGVRELFERLRSNGLQVALASSAKQDELATYKRIADIADLVDEETSSDDAKESKPHPDIFQAAIDRLKGVEAEDMLVVGDTPYDAEAASKAGLRTVGLRCGGWSAGELTQAGCVATFANPAELLARYADTPLAG